MSDEHLHQAPPAEDAGSQALGDALRSSFFIVKIIMVLLVLAFLGSGFFTVGPQEKAILVRLGKPVGEGENALLSPGFHWAFPKPIDAIERVPFTSVLEADSTVGWMFTPEERRRGEVPGPSPQSSLDPATITYALSADTNIVHVVASLRYRITDPIRYHFDFIDAATFVTNDLNNALLYATAQFPVDDVLTRNRTAFKEAVTARFDDLVHSQNLGIHREQLEVDAAAPGFLYNKFNEVVATTQKRDTSKKQAETYATSTLATARGKAATQMYEAESASSNLVNMITAEAKKFDEVRGEYERDPDFFQRVRQAAALEVIYTNAVEKILIPAGTHEVRLNLSREPQAPSTNTFAQ
jgi:membrane protease subunit HflK